MPASGYLSNPFFAALRTAEADFSVVHGVARRFRADTIPFAGVPEPHAKAMRDLAVLLAPGEQIYLTTEAEQTVEVEQTGLRVVLRFPGLQMRFQQSDTAATGEADGRVERLGAADVAEMLQLKARAFPGYFGPGAAELGSFFGVRDAVDGRLLAMGGERIRTFADREVSAVCTDPEHTGRGYAAAIVRAVVAHQASLGAGSILHVAATNRRAIALYEHLGFRVTGSLLFALLERDQEPV